MHIVVSASYLFELYDLVVSALGQILNFLHNKSVNIGSGDSFDCHYLLRPFVLSPKDLAISPFSHPFKQLEVIFSTSTFVPFACCLGCPWVRPSLGWCKGLCCASSRGCTAADAHRRTLGSSAHVLSVNCMGISITKCILYVEPVGSACLIDSPKVEKRER